MNIKKKNKIMAAALGSATLGIGISVAAIAQTCTADPVTPIGPDAPPATGIQGVIIAAVNLLASYQERTPPTNNTLALEILTSIERSLDSGGNLFEIDALTFGDITTNNVLRDGDVIYNITISNITGLGILNTEPHTIEGTIVFSIDNSTGTPVVGETNPDQLMANNRQPLIIESVNQLGNYSGTAPERSLAGGILALINSEIANDVGSGTVSTMMFDDIGNANVGISSNDEDIVVNINGVTGTISNGALFSGNLTLIISIGGQSVLAADSISGLQYNTRISDFINVLNSLRGYDNNQPPMVGTLGNGIIVALQAVVNSHLSLNPVITNFTYEEITTDNVNTTNGTYVVSFNSFSGGGTETNGADFVMGPIDSSMPITIVFTGIDVDNVNLISVGTISNLLIGF